MSAPQLESSTANTNLSSNKSMARMTGAPTTLSVEWLLVYIAICKNWFLHRYIVQFVQHPKLLSLPAETYVLFRIACHKNESYLVSFKQMNDCDSC